MRILFTGASSFTGMHFVLSLLEGCNEVWCTFTKDSLLDYDEVKKNRIQKFWTFTHNIMGTQVGDTKFLDAITNGNFDVVCMHAAHGTESFRNGMTWGSAIACSADAIDDIVIACKNSGVKDIVLSESYQQGRDGTISSNDYRFSKEMTSRMYQYACKKHGVNLRTFVIPNPFGPFENEKFTLSAMRAWSSGKAFKVNEPEVNTDNIHVDLLSQVYREFILYKDKNYVATQYQGSQWNFALKFAREMKKRLIIDTVLEIDGSRELDTPAASYFFHSDKCELVCGYLWNEEASWDELAKYYSELLHIPSRMV